MQVTPGGSDHSSVTNHGTLANSKYKPALRQLAQAGLRETFTLLHQGDDPEHNSATALQEFINELEAWIQE